MKTPAIVIVLGTLVLIAILSMKAPAQEADSRIEPPQSHSATVGEAPAPAIEETPIAAPVPAPAPAQISVPAPKVSTEPSEETTSLDSQAEQQFVQAQLQYLETLRSIPGAAGPLDRVVEYIKSSGVSLEALPTDENGVAVLDENSLSLMIPDEGIREDWKTLMKIMIANGSGT